MVDENNMTAGLRSADEKTARVLKESARVALGGDFLARCKQAVWDAQKVYLASVVVPQMGFSAHPVAKYLTDVVTSAGVSIDAVLRWARLKLDAPADGVFAAAWGRLAAELGLSATMALNHFRLTFLGKRGEDIAAELLNFYAEGDGETDPLAAFEGAVKGAVDRLDAAARTRLVACEEELCSSYHRATRSEGRK